jgi:hypothetical protein
MEVFSSMVFAIVQVAIVEHCVQISMVGIFHAQKDRSHLSFQIWIYVAELYVKTVELVLFKIPMDHTKQCASVDMERMENTANLIVYTLFYILSL